MNIKMITHKKKTVRDRFIWSAGLNCFDVQFQCSERRVHMSFDRYYSRFSTIIWFVVVNDLYSDFRPQ